MTKRFIKKKNYLIRHAYNLSFISFVSFINRFVDDYKVDGGEIENTSTENASSTIGNTPPTIGEHIQLERYLSAPSIFYYFNEKKI